MVRKLPYSRELLNMTLPAGVAGVAGVTGVDNDGASHCCLHTAPTPGVHALTKEVTDGPQPFLRTHAEQAKPDGQPNRRKGKPEALHRGSVKRKQDESLHMQLGRGSGQQLMVLGKFEIEERKAHHSEQPKDVKVRLVAVAVCLRECPAVWRSQGSASEGRNHTTCCPPLIAWFLRRPGI